MFRKKNKSPRDPFKLQADFEPTSVHIEHEERFFSEALADHPNSANEPNKSFVGPVISRKRFKIGIVLFISVLLLFTAKSASLQIMEGEHYRATAENNRTRQRVIPAQRGVVYDRNGAVLAQNNPVFRLVADPAHLPEPDNNEFYSSLAVFLNTDPETVRHRADTKEKDLDYVILADGLPYETAVMFEAQRNAFPGVDLELGLRRSYATDRIPTLSHVIGYTGIIDEPEYQQKKQQGYRQFDLIGKQGVEKTYEKVLRGQFGEEVLEVDALGRTERIVSKRDAVDGKNIHLTIDAELQDYIESVVEGRLSESEASRASVIVMDPDTGEVLALVSWPAFDANLFTARIDEETYGELIENEDLPLFARATSGEFPSGSTIKPVYAAGALIDGVISPQTSFLSTGGLRIGPWFFPDWRSGGHGRTNVYHAIADSVNTFFYMISGGYESFDGMGIERLMEHASLFGFGENTGVDIPGEADGFLPSKEWKLREKGEVWYIGDTYHAGIGQGDFLVTPLQIARSTAVFANGGNLVEPHVNKHLSPAAKTVADTEIIDIIRDSLRRTVTAGTAGVLNGLGVTSAGKTGTAQWSSTEPNHAWYTGFAPFEDPEIVVTVLVEEGADDFLAVPITADIYKWWFELGG